VTGSPHANILSDAAVGFYGKIPSRGDFVRGGLPRGFVVAWDAWMQLMLEASRLALAEEWLGAWLEAPIWRFALSPGTCGPDSALGLWLPSVDRAGRYFPLTLAAVARDIEPSVMIERGGGFLAAVEAAGLAAIECGHSPEALAALVARAGERLPEEAGVDPALCPAAGSLWWTAGAPRVAATAFVSSALPDGNEFAAMLTAATAAPPG
jgi:type VI secretion system protein ImpM